MNCKYCNNKTSIDTDEYLDELEKRVYSDAYIYNDNVDDSNNLSQRILMNGNKLRVEIDDFQWHDLWNDTDDYYRFEVEINYCPMCGRKLKGDDLK